MNLYLYKATITRVVDGDTFDVIVDLGFDVLVKSRFRLANIDTPETWRPENSIEKEHGEEATAFVMNAIEGKNVLIETQKTGKYGRHLAVVYLNEENYNKGISLSDALFEAGLEKRQSY